ncbi:hypothetical protein B6D60_00280 [candidate division KSB1 bacterium 4484_87]|nr:MAG: hypothetical protein B6D60_00280 [candidate division KSB1 bacterium 4484_87]
MKFRTIFIGLFIFLIFSTLQVNGQTRIVEQGKTEWDQGILFFRSNDGNFSTRFDVRMFINGAYFFENKNELSNGTHLRKGRFAMKTTLWKTWRAEWDIDVAEGVVEVKDMFFSYAGLNNSHIKVGNFKMPLGLNELTSSRYQTFVERAYPMLAFETDRRLGIEYSKWGNKWNVRAAVYGQTMDTEKNKTKDETGNGAAIRLAIAPVLNQEMILHAGVAAVYQKPDDETNAVKFNSEPETKIGDVEILDTDNIFNVDHFTRVGLEGVASYKSFTLQSEYIQTDVSRMNGYQNATFSGSYAFLSWVITGESKPWDPTQGEFGPIVPKSDKLGAWELAVRFSHLDLTDETAGIFGGMANNITVGLNWYANPNVRFLLNYTLVDNSKFATGDGFIGDDDFSVIHALAMVYF